MKILIAILISLSSAYGQVLNPSMLYDNVSEPNTCRFDDCYDLKTATERAGKFSYDSQEGMLDLFQARQTIKVRRGQLLPSFNLRIKTPIDIFDYIPNLVGFLFPSNWFRLKESKLHAKAQEYSYISLVANQKSVGKSLYLATHQELINLKTLENHIAFSESLLALMEKRFERGEVAYEDLAELNAFTSIMLADRVTMETLIQESASNLGYLLADVSVTELSGPSQILLPDLQNEPKLSTKDYIERVIKDSPELKSLIYLAEAARYSKKARAYEFLTPDSGTENAFGFGYLANLRIGFSEIEKLKIQKRAYETNLKKTLNVIIKQINSSLELYQYAFSIEHSLKYILESLLSDFEASSKIDINRYISILKDNLESQQMKYNAIHSYLLGKTQLERLLLEGKEYETIAKTIPTNNSSLDCYLRKENKIIRNAIANGTLEVPDEITFEDGDLSFCL